MFARLANSSILCLVVPYTRQKMSSKYLLQTSGLVLLWLIIFFSIFVMKNMLARATVIAAPWVCEKQCCVPE